MSLEVGQEVVREDGSWDTVPVKDADIAGWMEYGVNVGHPVLTGEGIFWLPTYIKYPRKIQSREVDLVNLSILVGRDDDGPVHDRIKLPNDWLILCWINDCLQAVSINALTERSFDVAIQTRQQYDACCQYTWRHNAYTGAVRKLERQDQALGRTEASMWTYHADCTFAWVGPKRGTDFYWATPIGNGHFIYVMPPKS